MFDVLADPLEGWDWKEHMEGNLNVVSLIHDPSMNLLVFLSELMESTIMLHKHKSPQQNFLTLSGRLYTAMMCCFDG